MPRGRKPAATENEKMRYMILVFSIVGKDIDFVRKLPAKDKQALYDFIRESVDNNFGGTFLGATEQYGGMYSTIFADIEVPKDTSESNDKIGNIIAKESPDADLPKGISLKFMGVKGEPRRKSVSPPKTKKKKEMILKFTVLDSNNKKVGKLDSNSKEEIYEVVGNIIDTTNVSLKASTLTVMINSDVDIPDSVVAEGIVKRFDKEMGKTEGWWTLVYKGDFTDIKKVASSEGVYQLNVMQSSLPREVYMVPVSYFGKNKKVEKLLYKYMDVDAKVKDNTWAEFYNEVSRKLKLNMDKEFKPYIFREGDTYTIERMLWIDYE